MSLNKGKREGGRGKRNKTKNLFLPFLFFSSLLFPLTSFLVMGCGPKYTFPGDTVTKSIEDITRKENKMEVIARVEGRTLGALYYVDDIVDEKGQVPKEVHEKMGQIMQAVSRVALSTDRPIDFCVVVIRDRAHLNELVVTRSLDDTRRANSEALGVEESINRTLFGQGKYQLAAGKENEFELRDIKMGTFLADQISQRIRFDFLKDAKDDTTHTQSLVLVDGLYDTSSQDKRLRFSVLSLKPTEPRQTMLNVFHIVNDVLGGYRFTDFKEIEVLDYLNRQKLVIDREVLEDFQAKKITDQLILNRYLTESQSVQEAFKLFGFNLSDSADNPDSPPLAPATP